ncbi:SRSO17 transposase [Nonomuraea jabiensis]|uniref:SRSO17 transposase n=1 Tax=Nonomuraea jabiensis TaxID=882448 RepID=A0A7W9L826_9ACTN|nr:hypothetical protein [Nonomuraea jabiensis]MBB5774025.1 SRSO17 transposase [Nonomuraea jabiensis]
MVQLAGADLNESGLRHYPARTWTPWHRHVTIAMLALAFLAVTRAILPTDADEATLDQGKDRPLLEVAPD